MVFAGAITGALLRPLSHPSIQPPILATSSINLVLSFFALPPQSLSSGTATSTCHQELLQTELNLLYYSDKIQNLALEQEMA